MMMRGGKDSGGIVIEAIEESMEKTAKYKSRQHGSVAIERCLYRIREIFGEKISGVVVWYCLIASTAGLGAALYVAAMVLEGGR